MNKKYVGITLIVVIVLNLACITQEKPKVVESARIEILEQADIEIDGLSSDWEGIAPIYKDSEKSMFVVIDGEYLVIRVDFVDLMPSKENYFVGIDIDYDEIMDYRIELNTKEKIVKLEEKRSKEWRDIESNAQGYASRIVEIAVSLTVLNGEGFFLTGWVYDTSLENVTAHFPWVRSLYPETEFDPTSLTRNEWKEDFEALYYLVKYNYPYLWVKERTHGYNWLDLKDDYMQRLDEIETNEEFLGLIMEALMTLQNGHTGLYNSMNEYWKELLSDYYHSCPEVFFYYFGGNYIAIGGLNDWKEKYGIEEGSKVVAINGIEVDEAVKSLVQKTRVWYDCDRNKLFMAYLDPTLFGEDAIFTIKNPDGNTVKKSIQYISEDLYKELYRVLSLDRDPDSNLEFRKWEDKKVAYVRIKSFVYSVSINHAKFLEFYREIGEYNALIIDIRGNGGGRIDYWRDNIVRPLTNRNLEVEFFVALRQGKYTNYWRGGVVSTSKDSISHLPSDVRTNNFAGVIKFLKCPRKSTETPFNGDIYLLVDREVYSAAESFAAFAKASGFAELVGTTTGGDGIGFGPFSFTLPNSKLVIKMTSGMGINPDGTANEETRTTPDIYFEQSEWGNDEEIITYVLEEFIDR
ncbi:MAG: hypothetical protein KAT49_00170 [Methanomicrobia archaeon]|nr:hypothetical protein [Methanomicrobia archaeon]